MAREVKDLLQDVTPAVGLARAQFALGQRVKARFGASGKGPSGTRWYPGTIVLLRPGGLYDVEYDDGDHEEAVLPKYIKGADKAQLQVSPSAVGYPFKKRRVGAEEPGPSDAPEPRAAQPDPSAPRSPGGAPAVGSAGQAAAVGGGRDHHGLAAVERELPVKKEPPPVSGTPEPDPRPEPCAALGEASAPRPAGVKPAVAGVKPAVAGVKPAVAGVKPAVAGVKPAVAGVKPAVAGVKPAVAGVKPAVVGATLKQE
eukprot:scaffold10717_cov155-Isochrysis_galbana.AAC.2